MKRKIMAMLVAVLILLSTLPTGIVAKADAPERKKVKVGYVASVNMMQGMADDKEKSGLGYDYLQKVSYYTNWEYEYVYGDWDEIYQKLIDGEVDVLAGLSKTEEREKLIAYPDYAMGSENYYIYVYDDNPLSTKGIEGLRGKTVSVNVNTVMEEYLRAWNINGMHGVQIKTYAGNNPRYEDFIKGEVDATVDTDNAIVPEDKMIPVARIGSSEYYLGVNKNRSDLLEDLNTALGVMESADPKFTKKLSDKYFSEMAVSSHMQEGETKWVEGHPEITVGYMNDYLPFSDTDKYGEATGIVTDIMTGIVGELNLQTKVKIKYVAFDRADDLLTALQNEEIDVAFPVDDNIYKAEQNHIYLTTTVISTPMNLVFARQYDENITKRIAVKKGNDIQETYTKKYFPESEIVYYDSFEASLEGVLKGEADSIIVNDFRKDGYLNNTRFKNMFTATLPNYSGRAMAVKGGNNALLSILNRGLTNLPENYAVSATSKYAGRLASYTLTDFIWDHLIATILVVVLVTALIFSLLGYVMHLKRKRHVLNEMAHKDSLTGIQNRRSYDEKLDNEGDSLGAKHTMTMVLDLNGLKTVNDSLGHAAGDEIIGGVADCMSKVLGSFGSIYRLGGDEFAAILTVPVKDQEELVEQLKDEFGVWKGEKCERLSVSVGYCRGSEREGITLKEMMKLSDDRMYQDKANYYRKHDRRRR